MRASTKQGQAVKDPLAVELGRRGGLKGGKARAAKLPARKRREIAQRAARGIPLGRCVGDIMREYFALRTEMLSVINSQGVPGHGHPGLVHSLVARMEERLGTRADARANEVAEGQRRLEIMLDRFVTVYLVHTWEVLLSSRRRPSPAPTDAIATTGVW